jgi:hypothetical protein
VLHSPPQGNTAPNPQVITSNPRPASCRPGSGKKGKSSRPSFLLFPSEQKNSGVPAARVFTTFSPNNSYTGLFSPAIIGYIKISLHNGAKNPGTPPLAKRYIFLSV